ncbi:MAG: hypothetical protein R3D67_01975 [Hyphomicrobiaceae bacterium]
MAKKSKKPPKPDGAESKPRTTKKGLGGGEGNTTNQGVSNFLQLVVGLMRSWHNVEACALLRRAVKSVVDVAVSCSFCRTRARKDRQHFFKMNVLDVNPTTLSLPCLWAHYEQHRDGNKRRRDPQCLCYRYRHYRW